ncbi:hypothetical protein, partial [Ferrithrix thermotolerans]|uniref:hypothetical protein n=1 Tax=Ferrithrix thermotolerans TaxID=209649 RepID=UPI001C49D9DD
VMGSTGGEGESSTTEESYTPPNPPALLDVSYSGKTSRMGRGILSTTITKGRTHRDSGSAIGDPSQLPRRTKEYFMPQRDCSWEIFFV